MTDATNPTEPLALLTSSEIPDQLVEALCAAGWTPAQISKEWHQTQAFLQVGVFFPAMGGDPKCFGHQELMPV